ncbi:MAG: flavin reductase [Sediminibacterium sp.]|jgi:flavin reductase (DIM6/NTAB) family NADH-FMN oxidoreductase RutF|nr:flavin reductase [Hydrotalea sp.]MCU0337805.1 flavin reductase [Sediminibacterium sp.]
MQHFSIGTIAAWDRFYRGNFMNSLSGFKSASLIGTIDQDKHLNLAIFSNIVHLGADPALIGFINRPLAAAPHTIENIHSTGEYTINLITANMVRAAHQTSAKYEKSVSEFDAVGLTPVFEEGIIAPFVAESPVKYALKYEQTIPIERNGTFLVIGSVQHVYVDEQLIETDGFLSLADADIITSLGLDGYYKTSFLERLPYAKAK